MNTRDLFLSLLRCAMGDGEALSKAKESLDSGSIATLFKVAKAHDMAHLVQHGLEMCGAQAEGEIGELFKKEKESAILRYGMIKADLAEICHCFDRESIDYVPLKGAVLRHLYPEPWMRTSCDIDVLVKESDLERAADALVKSCAYTTDYKKNYHDMSLFSPFGMHLELHHNIKEDTEKYDKILTRVWEFSKKEENSTSKHLQIPEYLMLHLICHMAYHFVGGGCGVRSVLDVWLLKRNTEFDEQLLYALLDEAGLTKFYEAIARLAEHWFGFGETNSLLFEMEKYILLGGVYGTKRQGAAAKQVKKGGRFKYFWSRVFMPYRDLVILYPVLKKHKILTPVCQIRRWLGAIFKSKRLAHEIKNVTSVTPEVAEQTKWLLTQLEI